MLIEKRTFDSLLYTLVCTGVLADDETIATVGSVTADQGGLTFGAGVANLAPITLPDGTVLPAGKAIQMRISGGVIPLGSDSRLLGVPNLLCTVRPRFTTNQSPNAIEATFPLLLLDMPGRMPSCP